MQFDELCALVGALRDRVADLEAKEAARAKDLATKSQIVLGERWRIDARGSKEIQDAVAAGVRAGYAVADRNRLAP